jgi:hypothetical protein
MGLEDAIIGRSGTRIVVMKENVYRVNGSDIWVRTPTITITTDAAKTEWAAWTEGMVARGSMIEQERYQHSN